MSEQTPVAATFVPLSERIRQNAAGDPDGCAIAIDSLQFSWAALDAALNRIASRLAADNIERGDRIAIIGPNSPEYLLLFLGGLRAGACMVPLPTMTAPESLAGMVVDAEARMLFAASAKREVIDSVRAQLPGSLEGFVGLDFSGGEWAPWSEWLAGGSDGACGVEVGPDDLFNIMYSSGTTGEPKGIVHSHAMRDEHVRRMARFGIGPGAVTLISTPLYSNTTHACLLGSIGLRGRTILMRKFDVSTFLRISQTERVTHAMLVPVQYQRVLGDPEFDKFDLDAFRWKLCTSAPLSPIVKREAVTRWPGKMLEIYGHSEGGANCTLMIDEHMNKLHTVGKPIAGCDIRMIGEDGRELPRGQAGEIVGRQPAMMKGYFKQPEKTEAVTWYDAQGNRYYRSGDVGYFDEDGFLVLLDRTKDMIVSGGFNVYAVDIERVIEQHPGVGEVAVIGVPSVQWGETPLAFVVPRLGAEIDPGEVREFANQRLGKLQRVSAVVIRDSLPRSDVGKILKRELRAHYWPPTPHAGAPNE
jgi:acyl-CoA synthetase (AMP-forming)/AMP-acid ligase II